MYSRTATIAVVILLVGGCTCLSRVPVPEREPVEKAAAPAPQPMVREAEQVIAIAEKAPLAEKEAPSTANLSAPPPAGASRCWLKSDMRTIATEQNKDGSCQVVYDSAGQNHVVASKSKDLAECTRLHERLKKNLIASGFKCE